MLWIRAKRWRLTASLPRRARTRTCGSNRTALEAIQKKLDRLDEAFLFDRTTDIDVYDRHATGSTASTWKVSWPSPNVPCRAPHTCGCRPPWTSASGFSGCFPEGMAFDGNGLVGTAVTAPAFNYLQPIEGE